MLAGPLSASQRVFLGSPRSLLGHAVVAAQLQRLTNGALRSTSHRVINPVSDRAKNARFSMPFFLHFNPDFPIAALPSCVGPGRPEPLPPILAEEYLQERLREIKLK